MKGSELRSLRKRLHVDQSALARRVGVDVRAVSNVEADLIGIDPKTSEEWQRVILQLGRETEAADGADRVPAAL